MKKNVKILSIVLMALTILSVVCSVALAYSPTDIPTNASIETSGINTLAGKVFSALRIFGTIASVLILAVLGIKYMTSSPEGKADYKANMVPYIVGAVLLFGATNVASLVYNALNS